MQGEEANDRRVFRITGKDRTEFLQNLVTNDLARLSDGLVYAALLTPQGKYLADFFLVAAGDAILLDVQADLADSLIRRLSMYRLRSDVAIGPADLHVQRGLGAPPADALPDPRHPALGWRRYAEEPGTSPAIDWDAIRVEHLIPETGAELQPEESYILECGFERMGGVDFRKGCYVGQEVTARMKHKTELRKGLVQVEVLGPASPGDDILSDGRPVGRLHTRAGDRAIAYLRFNRADGVLTAGGAEVRLTPP
ncbi:YgfZ/GcvT domain-containing protein [Halodurantibacterium flavum]|uniref:YgfZ/GcvT domain-containing protein n=1 Tax=Halodurantibacterium flavum TaxID=1382802 RepID=A0ABW4S6F6_9RHOB